MTPDPELATRSVEAIALAFAAGAVIVVVVGILILYAARRPFPASIVTSLTILATLSLVGYAVGGEARPELAAIAGTAVGALAGATTSLLIRDDGPPPPPPDPEGDAA